MGRCAWHRPVVLVGLMGAGKTAVGRRLAARLGCPFHDADDAIVAAAGMDIPEIFARFGEPAFRELERRVVLRLLTEEHGVIALGGGAFLDDQIRACVKQRARSVWLRAELEVLVARTARRPESRPLLMGGDRRAILRKLMTERYPIYAEADVTVTTGAGPVEAVVDRVMKALRCGSGSTP